MKKTYLLLALLISLCGVECASYYFATDGDDSRSASTATNSATPWQTLEKFNAIQSTLQPGDNVYFKRGHKWYGALRITAAGSAASPITLSAYGVTTDPLPIFSGTTLVTGWTLDSSKGPNVYYATVNYPTTVASVVAVSDVFSDSTILTPARAPNLGSWYRITNKPSDNVVEDTSRSEADGYFNGATLRARTSDYLWYNGKVNSYSNKRFTLSQDLNGGALAGFGYFLEGKVQFLDSAGEWFYDSSTTRLYVRLPASDNPTSHSIEASIFQKGIELADGAHYITIRNLQVERSSEYNIDAFTGTNNYIIIWDCVLRYCNEWSVRFHEGTGSVVKGTRISFAKHGGIDLGVGTTNNVAQDNYVSDISLTLGYGGQSAIAPGQYATGSAVISGNRVDRTGYNGIHFGGMNVKVINNLVLNTMQTLSDGGSIYGWGTFTYGSLIENNTVLYATGGIEGLPVGSNGMAHGIYVDDDVHNLTVRGNTVGYCSDSGIFLHNNWKVNVVGNTIFGNEAMQLNFETSGPNRLYDNVISQNTIAPSTKTQLSVKEPYENNVVSATYQSNFYCNPFLPYGISRGKNNDYWNYFGWVTRGNGQPDEVTPQVCNVRATDCTINSYISGTLISNGDFATDTSGWDEWGGNGISRISNAEGCVGSCLRYAIAPSGDNICRINTPTFAVDQQYYYLEFTAHSSTVNRFGFIHFEMRTDPYSRMVDAINFVLTNTPTRYTFVLPRMTGTPNAASVVVYFSFERIGGTAYLANVALRPVQATCDSPLKVFYNFNYQPQAVALTANRQFMDLLGNNMSGSVNIAPYKAIILLDRGVLASGTTAAASTTTLAASTTAKATTTTTTAGSSTTGKASTTTTTTGTTSTTAKATTTTTTSSTTTSGCGAPGYGNGDGLQGSYYSGQNFNQLVGDRVDPIINFDFAGGAPTVSGMPTDSFSIKWTGTVQPRFSGTYTFYTSADDGTILTVNNVNVVSDWNAHAETEVSGTISLTAGQNYSIQLQFKEETGLAVIRLRWSHACEPKAIIPQSQLFSSSPNGIRGEYYSGQNFNTLVGVRVDSLINFAYGSGAPTVSGMPTDNFSIKWFAKVLPRFTGTYTFYTSADDGTRLYVNGQQLIDDWTGHSELERSGTISLNAGQFYNLELHFLEQCCDATVRLLWSHAQETKAVIPSSQLFAN